MGNRQTLQIKITHMLVSDQDLYCMLTVASWSIKIQIQMQNTDKYN